MILPGPWPLPTDRTQVPPSSQNGQNHLRVEVVHVALREIIIREGECKYITAPSTVMVFVGGKQCVCTID